MLFKCKLQTCATRAVGFFASWTVHKSFNQLRARAASAGVWQGLPPLPLHGGGLSLPLLPLGHGLPAPLPRAPALAARAKSTQGPAEGSGKHHCGAILDQPRHPNQLRLILLSAALAS